MAPSLSEEEIDDLVYLARAGEDAELTELLQELATRDAATPADILVAAREDQSKATCLHMAAANGHASKFSQFQAQSHVPLSFSPWRRAIGVARHASTVRCRKAINQTLLCHSELVEPSGMPTLSSNQSWYRNPADLRGVLLFIGSIRGGLRLTAVRPFRNSDARPLIFTSSSQGVGDRSATCSLRGE